MLSSDLCYSRAERERAGTGASDQEGLRRSCLCRSSATAGIVVIISLCCSWLRVMRYVVPDVDSWFQRLWLSEAHVADAVQTISYNFLTLLPHPFNNTRDAYAVCMRGWKSCRRHARDNLMAIGNAFQTPAEQCSVLAVEFPWSDDSTRQPANVATPWFSVILVTKSLHTDRRLHAEPQKLKGHGGATRGAL